MATTFLKRQKEMKRLEKQRIKAERRVQKKLAKKAGNEAQSESASEAIKSEPSTQLPAELRPLLK